MIVAGDTFIWRDMVSIVAGDTLFWREMLEYGGNERIFPPFLQWLNTDAVNGTFVRGNTSSRNENVCNKKGWVVYKSHRELHPS